MTAAQLRADPSWGGSDNRWAPMPTKKLSTIAGIVVTLICSYVAFFSSPFVPRTNGVFSMRVGLVRKI